MPRKSHEFVVALAAIIVITLAYLFVQTISGGTPTASSFFGHSLGVLGFILMMMTETLYSIRKRSRRARLGKMSDWLEFHIFTGLVGPYMVLLHPGWQFKGLAGVVSLLTIVMVISGFIGRYIFTAIPRTAEGAEIGVTGLVQQVRQLEMELASLKNNEDTRPISKQTVGSGNSLSVLSRFWYDLQAVLVEINIRLRQSGQTRQKALQLARLRRRLNQLHRQINNLAAARRLLSLWHTIHIPLGLTLFLIAFIHIGAAIYYALLLK